MGFVAKQIGGWDLVLKREEGPGDWGREDAVTKQDRKDLLNDILPCQQVAHSCPELRNLRFYLRQSYPVERCSFAFFLKF